MAITGHKNQQSLADYDELDNDDHNIRLGKVLSYNKNEVITHVQYSMQHNHLLNYSSCAPAPVFNMQNCKVIIETPSSQPCKQAPKKRCHITDSDSDSE